MQNILFPFSIFCLLGIVFAKKIPRKKTKQTSMPFCYIKHFISFFEFLPWNLVKSRVFLGSNPEMRGPPSSLHAIYGIDIGEKKGRKKGKGVFLVPQPPPSQTRRRNVWFFCRLPLVCWEMTGRGLVVLALETATFFALFPLLVSFFVISLSLSELP